MSGQAVLGMFDDFFDLHPNEKTVGEKCPDCKTEDVPKISQRNSVMGFECEKCERFAGASHPALAWKLFYGPDELDPTDPTCIATCKR